MTEPGDPEPKLRRARQRPAHRPARVPRLEERRTGRGADRRHPALARRPRVVRDRLFVHVRERAARRPALPVRHIEQNVNVPMYRTNIACRPAGRFSGPMVVSMRPLTPAQAVKATQDLFAIPASPRRAGPLRRPGRDRHSRHHQARLRRPGEDQAGRDAGLLGLRRHAAGGARWRRSRRSRSRTSRATCS